LEAEASGHQHSSLRDYLRVLRRRKWLVIQAVLLVPAAAVALSLRQDELYQASADVLLSRQNLAATLTGTDDPNQSAQAERVAQTQADLARVPTVAARVLEATGLADRTPSDFLADSTASPKANSDLLVLSVTDRDPRLASRLATEYARQFTIYRRELDTRALQRARKDLQTKIAEIEETRATDTPLYESLIDKEQQLATLEALQTTNAFVVRPANNAKQVQPRPIRNGILGLALGLVLGLGLAFLREAMDTRVRTAEEIAERLGLPLLARLPKPPKRLRGEGSLVMLAEPSGVHAESFRMLRTNLEFVNLERGARTIMVTSAVEREGKSTTAANLAVALALGGQRVTLVDLDLRRPLLGRLFELEPDQPGLTDVALGYASLDDAATLVGSVAITAARNGHRSGNRNGRAPQRGMLQVLPAGPVPPNPGEFVRTKALAEILAELAERADLVLIDAPPMLQVGDAMALSDKVDALLLVSRLNIVRRPILAELHRVLQANPATKLGFVLTGAELEDAYGYGGYAGYYSYKGYASVEQSREPVA
jgi:polysaccharide biosynthesis transport protein